MLNIKINNIQTQVEEGTTILEAARDLNIDIPTLCHLDLHNVKYINKQASCRVCMVEDARWGNLLPSCATPVKDQMEILTDSPKATRARRAMVELILSDHPNECLTCVKNLDCDLQSLAEEMNIRQISYQGEKRDMEIDSNSLSIVRDPNKCIMCRRCQTMCTDMQTVGALAEIGRGFDSYVGSTFDRDMHETTCTFCGQCLSVCPTGALTEVSNIDQVWEAIEDKDKFVIVQTAPAVRVALGEEFGMEPGTVVTSQMIGSLRRLGFDKVFDTNFAADLTVMEEANELIERLESKEVTPLLTSCCPGWINFIEQQFPDMLSIPSSCKSPHEMFGAVAKSYLAEKLDIRPEDMVVVSIMPCVAKKYESKRPELMHEFNSDVDIVITTRELAAMIKEAGIHFDGVGEDQEFDNPLGESTGAGTIFGATGGVLEATVRTAYHVLTNEELEDLEFTTIRGFDGIKEATVEIGQESLNIAVANGLGNTRKILEDIQDGKKTYHAIEIMACPGGCIGGGGQPYHHGDVSKLEKRAQGIYSIDRSKEKKRAHENKSIQKLYQDYLGHVGSDRAQDLLHTSYKPRPKL